MHAYVHMVFVCMHVCLVYVHMYALHPVFLIYYIQLKQNTVGTNAHKLTFHCYNMYFLTAANIVHRQGCQPHN